jgi:hypothetical protein
MWGSATNPAGGFKMPAQFTADCISVMDISGATPGDWKIVKDFALKK